MENYFRIIIIDDEEAIRKSIENASISFFHKYGQERYTPKFFSQIGSSILSLIQDNEDNINTADIAFVDYNLANDLLNGLEIAEKIKSKNKNINIAFVSGQADFIDIRRKDKNNIISIWIPKPITIEVVSNCLSSVIYKKESLAKENELKTTVEFLVKNDLTQIQKNAIENNIVFSSKKMERIIEKVIKVSSTNTRVLITGDNGTGKENIAKMIHKLSHRKSSPFIAVNCAAIPSDLIESELFGHEKGSFTSAIKQRLGKFEQADTGTIFLDEIGDMDLSVQAKLLRVLQENEISRVGSEMTIKIDVRVLAATNKNLRTEIISGKFREDLFYRINQFPIELPTLKDRGIQDVELLINFFLNNYSKQYNKNIELSKDALNLLLQYNYPGNIRELKNLIERLTILTEDKITKELIIGEDIFLQDNRLQYILTDDTKTENNSTANNLSDKERSMIPAIKNELEKIEDAYITLLNDKKRIPTMQEISLKIGHGSNTLTVRFNNNESLRNVIKYLLINELYDYKICSLLTFKNIINNR